MSPGSSTSTALPVSTLIEITTVRSRTEVAVNVLSRYALTLLLTVCMTTMLACKGDPDAVTPEQAQLLSAQALEPRAVTLISAEERVEHPSIELVGEIRAFDTVHVPSEIVGKVDQVLVEVGDRVAAGDPLAEIDRQTYRLHLDQVTAEVAAAKADLELASKELQRKQDLRSDETIPQSVLDQAAAQHDQAKARLEATQAAHALANRDLERSLVTAPAGGSIAERMVSEGSWADVGTTLFALAIGDTAKVAARVPEAWVTRIGGLEGFEFRAGAAGPVRTAELFSIDPVLEGSSRSFEVVGTADNRDSALRPGMFATITLTSPEEARSLWLPVDAVVISDLPQVLLSNDGLVIDRDVQTGRRDGAMIEIVSGLEPGEGVISDVSGLSRGLPVTTEQR